MREIAATSERDRRSREARNNVDLRAESRSDEGSRVNEIFMIFAKVTFLHTQVAYSLNFLE